MSGDRFSNISEEELQKIIYEKNAKNTHKSTTFSWNCFTNYYAEKKILVDVKNISKG